MATLEAGETRSGGKPDVETVGSQFLEKYYFIFQFSPEFLHKFYKDDSVLKWPGVEPATTMEGIIETTKSSGYAGCEVKVVHADVQESLMESVILTVSGSLLGNDKVKKIFTQTFFLAKQETGFYVLNDSFRVLDTKELLKHSFTGEVEEEVASPVVESGAVAPADVPAAQPEPDTEVSAVTAAGATESVEKTPDVTVAAAEVPKEAVPVTQNIAPPAASSEKLEAKKFSYASVVAKVSKVAPRAENSAPKVIKVAPTANHQSAAPSAPSTGIVKKERTPVSHGAREKNAVNNDFRSEASISRSVYIRDLPKEITKPELADAMKQFGQVKPDEIQIRAFDDGFCFGFVEFESAAMAKAAVEAHTVMVKGYKARISLKKARAESNGPRTGGGFHGRPFRGGYDKGGEHHSDGRGYGEDGRGGEFRAQGRGAERPNREFGFRSSREGRAQGAGDGQHPRNNWNNGDRW